MGTIKTTKDNALCLDYVAVFEITADTYCTIKLFEVNIRLSCKVNLSRPRVSNQGRSSSLGRCQL